MFSADLNYTQNIGHENKPNENPTSDQSDLLHSNILNNASTQEGLVQEKTVEPRDSGANISQDLQNTFGAINNSGGEAHIFPNLHPGQHSLEKALANHLVNNTKNEEHHSSNNEKQWISSHLGNSELAHNPTNLAQEIIRAHGIDEQKLKKNLKGKKTHLSR